MKNVIWITALTVVVMRPLIAEACTGITLKTTNDSTVTARTIEWAGSDLESKYAVVPRGYVQRSFVPEGAKDGIEFTAKFGYVGLDRKSTRLNSSH